VYSIIGRSPPSAMTGLTQDIGEAVQPRDKAGQAHNELHAGRLETFDLGHELATAPERAACNTLQSRGRHVLDSAPK
jgi:hypothetical protein